MESYAEHKAIYDRVFSKHKLEMVLHNDPFRAYMLRPEGGGHPDSVMVMFTPEGIVIMGDHAPTRTGICATGYDLKWFSEKKNPEYLAGKFDLPDGYNQERAIAHIREQIAGLSDESESEPSREDYQELLESLLMNDAGEHEFYSKLHEWGEDEWYLRARGFDPTVMAKLTAIQHRFAELMGDLEKEKEKEVSETPGRGADALPGVTVAEGAPVTHLKQYLDPAQDVAQISALERECRKCHCTEMNACMVEGQPCHWVENDLCSACVTKA